MQKENGLSEEALQIVEKRREARGKKQTNKQKQKDIPIWMQSSK